MIPWLHTLLACNSIFAMMFCLLTTNRQLCGVSCDLSCEERCYLGEQQVTTESWDQWVMSPVLAMAGAEHHWPPPLSRNYPGSCGHCVWPCCLRPVSGVLSIAILVSSCHQALGYTSLFSLRSPGNYLLVTIQLHCFLIQKSVTITWICKRNNTLFLHACYFPRP